MEDLLRWNFYYQTGRFFVHVNDIADKLHSNICRQRSLTKTNIGDLQGILNNDLRMNNHLVKTVASAI